MGLVATRAVTLQGQTYRPGEAVETHGLSSEKAQQLVALRILTDTDISAPSRCVALRALHLGGRAYQRGDLIDVSRLRPDKISQLLEHRIIDLAPAGAGSSKATVRRTARA